jgi:hypothetical protein
MKKLNGLSAVQIRAVPFIRATETVVIVPHFHPFPAFVALRRNLLVESAIEPPVR